MADYVAMARNAARRAGLDPNIFVRQIRQESGFRPDARSPAGALGIAQIMPATARGWKVDPMDPQAALNAAARNMASYVRKYGGYENALRAYNAGPGAIQASRGYKETNHYVQTILGGRDPGKLQTPSRTSSGGSSQTTTTTTDPTALVAQALLPQTLPERPKVQVSAPRAPEFAARLATATAPGGGALPTPSAPIQPRQTIGAALEAMQKLAPTTNTAVIPGETTTTTSGGGGGNRRRGSLAAGGDYSGTTNPVIALAKLGHSYGLQTTSAKRPTVNTASGNVSDHYAGNKSANARDLSGSVADMDRAAVALARRLGITGYKKGQRLERSIVRDGLRYQILYRTNTGGNHFNHIHVGVKRV